MIKTSWNKFTVWIKRCQLLNFMWQKHTKTKTRAGASRAFGCLPIWWQLIEINPRRPLPMSSERREGSRVQPSQRPDKRGSTHWDRQSVWTWFSLWSWSWSCKHNVWTEAQNSSSFTSVKYQLWFGNTVFVVRFVWLWRCVHKGAVRLNSAFLVSFNLFLQIMWK